MDVVGICAAAETIYVGGPVEGSEEGKAESPPGAQSGSTYAGRKTYQGGRGEGGAKSRYTDWRGRGNKAHKKSSQSLVRRGEAHLGPQGDDAPNSKADLGRGGKKVRTKGHRRGYPERSDLGPQGDGNPDTKADVSRRAS